MILAPMILLLDNYDSFTWNLAHLLGASGRRVDVIRNDKITAEAATDGRYDSVVISPGPCTPDEAGVSVEIVRRAHSVGVPVFGVCLGLQSIVQAFGGRIVRAEAPMHGKVSAVRHDGAGMFDGVPQAFPAARYHSLVADPATLPECLVATAFAPDGAIMAAAHRAAPIAGVQFHPESIATEHGARLLENFFLWASDRAVGR